MLALPESNANRDSHLDITERLKAIVAELQRREAQIAELDREIAESESVL